MKNRKTVGYFAGTLRGVLASWFHDDFVAFGSSVDGNSFVGDGRFVCYHETSRSRAFVSAEGGSAFGEHGESVMNNEQKAKL